MTHESIRAGAALAEHLATTDLICSSCGYNLRGSALATCPECGAVIPLPIVEEDPASSGWRTVRRVLEGLTLVGLMLAVLGAVSGVAGGRAGWLILLGSCGALWPIATWLWWIRSQRAWDESSAAERRNRALLTIGSCLVGFVVWLVAR